MKNTIYKKQNKKYFSNGFTLLEMIVVVGVFAMVLVATSELFITIFSLYKNTNNSRRIYQDTRYVLETISREAKLAKVIYVDKINNIITTTSKDDIQIEFKLSGGNIIMTSPPGGTSQNLTSINATNITSFDIDDSQFPNGTNSIQPFFKLTITAESKEVDSKGNKQNITLTTLVSKRNYY